MSGAPATILLRRALIVLAVALGILAVTALLGQLLELAVLRDVGQNVDPALAGAGGAAAGAGAAAAGESEEERKWREEQERRKSWRERLAPPGLDESRAGPGGQVHGVPTTPGTGGVWPPPGAAPQPTPETFREYLDNDPGVQRLAGAWKAASKKSGK